MTIVEKFKFIQSILEEANVKYWLFCGGLLFAYRDNKLPTDDIDFGLLMADYEATKAILEKYRENWTLFNYRSRELTVRFEDTKFDFVFHNIDNDKNLIYMYSYKQNPFCSMKWNYEWRAKFPIDIFLPTKTYTFKINMDDNIQDSITTPIVQNPEKYFYINYGEDWMIPRNIKNECWTYDLNSAKDKEYNPIAVVMTTIARDDSLMKILPSYLKYPIKLYLLDQGNPTEEKNKYYKELRQQGHFIEYSPEVGLSAARNLLLSHVEEECVLMTEDDIELTTNPYCLLQNFWNNNLGILGGLLIRNNKEQHYEYELELNNGILQYKKSDKIDLCLNFFLAKRKLFNDILYDEAFKLVEHTDFFLRLKQLNKWKVDYTRNLVGIHHPFKPEVYMQYRRRTEEYITKFKQKWGINSIIKPDENNASNHNRELTVFVITLDNEPNYPKCIEALSNQTCTFTLDIIKNFHPMSAAFQEMLVRCKTPYYIQVDSDMILNADAIEKLYQSIVETKPQEAMICHRLHDEHLNKTIDGIKIYKFDIFKKYPYNNVVSCEVDQLNSMAQDGFTYIRKPDVVGVHHPVWTEETIFERYFNYIEKLKKFQSTNYITLLNRLLDIFIKTPTKINLYGLLGAIASCISEEPKDTEKDFTEPILYKFKMLDDSFKNFGEENKSITIPNQNLTQQETNNKENKKILVLQIAGIPCANRPYDINQLINTYSNKYRSRHILGGQYAKYHNDIPYREFPYDLLLKDNIEEIKKLLSEAEIIHIHHRIDRALLRLIPKNKKIIFTVSNLGSSLKINNTPENIKYNEIIKQLSNIITTTEQPLQIKAYDYLTNRTLPLVKNLFNCATTKNNNIPLIVFAPTNRGTDEFTSKGYFRVLGIIYKLKLEGYLFNFDLIEGIPYTENLNRKKIADIVIDDVVNENYHNTSVEAGCFGAVVLTNHHSEKYPFLKTDLNSLEERLKQLISKPDLIKQYQQEMINWANTIYTPKNILTPFETIYDEMINSDSIQSKKISTKILNSLEIIKLLNDNHILYYLAGQSCLEIVKNHKVNDSILFVGVNNLDDINKIKEIYSYENLIVVHEHQAHMKEFKLNNISIKIPFPVVKYLEKKLGKPWKELIND